MRRVEAIRAESRTSGLDWNSIETELNNSGCAVLRGILTPTDCDEIAGMYGDDSHFRKRVVMARHGFGSGEYKYLRYPLPELVAELRTELYPGLAKIANRWNELMAEERRFPASHEEYLKECRAAGQREATPLVLKYGVGDYNCLHQDLYGDMVFPFQVAFLLSEPGRDFEGGEFVLVEQRPRMQSRPEVVPLRKGDAVAFPVHHRPVKGSRGYYRVNMRHGVSRIRRGQRFTMGIIFHDATT